MYPPGRPRPRAILFDLDDTLFDHLYSMRASIAKLVSHFPRLANVPLVLVESTYRASLEELHVHVLAGTMTIPQARQARVQRILELAGPVADPGVVAEGVQVQKDGYQASRRAVPGTHALLRHLRDHARIGVVTNNVHAEQVEKLEVCGLTDLVDTLVTSEEVGIPKPDPAMFHVAMDRLGVDPQDCVMVGDSWSSDVVGAQRANIRPVWFVREPPEPRPPNAASVPQLTSFEPLEAVVQMLLDDATGV